MAKAALSAPSTSDYRRLAKEAVAKGKVSSGRPRRVVSATPRRIYFDLPVPRESGTVYLLTPHDVGRLRAMEARNRLRVRKASGPWPDAIVEAVDFIAVCIKQEWLCCICHNLMDPSLKGTNKRAISVEHSPALSLCNEHSARTVYAAHVCCNVEKGHGSDTPRAAKVKRIDKSQERHNRLLRMKGVMTPAAFRREKIKERIEKGNKAIQPRPFPKLIETRESRAPGKILSAGFQKRPEGFKHSWPKRRMGK